jgi:hypothetical protein
MLKSTKTSATKCSRLIDLHWIFSHANALHHSSLMSTVIHDSRDANEALGHLGK